METFLERSRNTSRVGSPSADAAAGVDVFAEGFHLTKQRGQFARAASCWAAAHNRLPAQLWIWILRGRALSAMGTVTFRTPSRITASIWSELVPCGRGTLR